MPQIQNLGNITYSEPAAMSNYRRNAGGGGFIKDMTPPKPEPGIKPDLEGNPEGLTVEQLQARGLLAKLAGVDYDTKLQHYNTAIEYAKLLPEAAQEKYLNTPEVRAYADSLGLPYPRYAMPSTAAASQIPFGDKRDIGTFSDVIKNKAYYVAPDPAKSIDGGWVPLNTVGDVRKAAIMYNVPLSMVDSETLKGFKPTDEVTPEVKRTSRNIDAGAAMSKSAGDVVGMNFPMDGVTGRAIDTASYLVDNGKQVGDTAKNIYDAAVAEAYRRLYGNTK